MILFADLRCVLKIYFFTQDSRKTQNRYPILLNRYKRVINSELHNNKKLNFFY